MHLHHIGWAVRSLDAHHTHFAGQLGLPYEGVEQFPTLSVAFYDAGGSLIELLEATDPGDEVATFLESRGEGIHHLAYAVDDVAEALRLAEERGLTLLDRVPRPGARGTRIGFADPGRPDGVLVEYVEVP
jgi:methylmalonyl-CoA/ethylmalonyl-CoA epimerase